MDSFEMEIRRLEKWCRGEEAAPTNIDLFPTHKCNLSCRFCDYPNVEKEKYEQELSTKKILQLIEEAGNLNSRVFCIVGGEPFVLDSILEIMERIKEGGMDGSITTNGTLLEERQVKKIIKIEWDQLRISIDGIGPTHDYLRGKEGAFGRLVRTLELFDEHRNSHPTIEINTVLNRKNYDEISEIVELANNYSIGRVILLPMININQKASDLEIKEKEEDVKKNLLEAKRIAKKRNVEINVDEVLERNFFSNPEKTDKLIEDKVIPCFMPWYSISINARGLARPCDAFDDEFGVDVRGKTLKEVWHSKEFESIRKLIAKKELPEACSRCCAPLIKENEEIRAGLEKQKQKNLVERYS